VRDVVRLRAADACEYCLMPTTGKFEIEHIIPKQRWPDFVRGHYPGLRCAERLALATPDHIANFAWSCFFSNCRNVSCSFLAGTSTRGKGLLVDEHALAFYSQSRGSRGR